MHVDNVSMDFIRKLENIQELATLPTVAFRILELVEDPKATMDDISQAVETDPSLTVKILRVANSPLYGFRTEISSVRQAIISLGLNRISNIVVGVALFTKFFNTSARQNVHMREFWRHSTSTGIVAKSLARRLKISFNEREFVGGLIHDIGKMVMIQYFPEQYDAVLNIIRERQVRDVVAEREIFGVDHNVAGRALAKMWQLPADLTDVIASHSTLPELSNARDITAVVRIADLLCEMWGASSEEGILELELERERAWNVLANIRPELRDLDVEVFTFELEQEFKKAELFINLMLGD